MTITAVKKTLTSTKLGRYFKPNVTVEPNGLVDVAYTTTTSENASAPYTVTLYSEQLSASGELIQKPKIIATYNVEPEDETTKVSFDFSYNTNVLSKQLRAVFWTQPVGDFEPGDQTILKMQLLTNAGAKKGKPISLGVVAGKTEITDLDSEGLGTLVGFGKTFMVCYSTFNPANEDSEIGYEEFNDAGKALKSGTIATPDDGFAHGVSFGSYLIAGHSRTPYYMLLYRAAFSPVTIEIDTLKANGAAGPINTSYTPDFSNLGIFHEYDSFSFERPATTGAKDDYGVLTETFIYNYDPVTETGDIGIGVQTLNSKGVVTHHIDFQLTNGLSPVASSSAHICHVENGDIVVGYNNGSESFLQEYNSSLVMIGKAIELSPATSTGDLVNIVALSGDRFEAFWRQDTSPIDGVGKLHTEIFSASAG